jgi:hypothetical protein
VKKWISGVVWVFLLAMLAGNGLFEIFQALERRRSATSV